MSMELLIVGKYRNNKEKAIGAFNPENNRDFNQDEVDHVCIMFRDHFKNNLTKFKYIRIMGWIDGKFQIDKTIHLMSYSTIHEYLGYLDHIREA